MQRRVLHRFVMMAKRQMPGRVGDQLDGEDRVAQESKYYHRSYEINTGKCLNQKISTPLLCSLVISF